MNKVKINKFEKQVSQILEKYKINNPPIDVKKIAEKLKIVIKIKPYDGKDDFSGVLIRDAQQTVIGVNAFHNMQRRRFTIAHELGHFLLHEIDPLFIDKKISIYYRHSTATDGADEKEIEANLFAGMLLIPTKFLEEDISKETTIDETVVAKLAKKYKVSDQAMSRRLAKL